MAFSSGSTFLTATERIITNWNSLKIAVENGMGGPQAMEKVKWLTEVINDLFCNETATIFPDEVEDYIAEILNNEFDTRVEDGSLSQIAQSLCRLYQMYSRKENAEFEAEINALPNPTLSSWKWNSQNAVSNNDTTLNNSQIKRSVPQTEDIQIDEEDDGWEVVGKSRRR